MLMRWILPCLLVMLTACAAEADYPIVTPDTSDQGLHEVAVYTDEDGVLRTVEGDHEVPTSDTAPPSDIALGASYLASFDDPWEQAARDRCKEMNRFFGPGSDPISCANTQGVDYLATADASCDHQVNVMPPECYDEFANVHYWGNHYYTRPYPQLPYGDYFDWICINGWAVLRDSPYRDDTEPLRQAFHACVGPGW